MISEVKSVKHEYRRSNLFHIKPFFLLVLVGFIGSSQAFCPSKCQCLGGDANSKAFCVDAALEDVPIQLNPETRYINLTQNKIRTIAFTLPFYMKLEVLDLSQNIIETLGSKNFEYQTELRTLNMSHNSVSALQKDAFKGLTSLVLLDLSFNRIETVHHTAMNDLTSLVEVDLTNNNIVSMEDNCFRSLISLEILIFKNNQLLDVPSNNMQHLHSLKSLDLSDNLLEYVRNDSFEGLKELMALTMRGNVISELDLGAFEGLIALRHLDIADNNLTMVPTEQLSKLSNLTYLSLSGNRFTHLPAVAFLNLFHLKEMHLNRLDHLNRIDSRAFVDNTHLRSLYLTKNPQLNELPNRLFQGNPNILEIFMQGNNLQILHASQFPVDQLQRLYLGDNPLHCNCSLVWLWRLVTGNFEETQNKNEAGMTVAALGTSKDETEKTRGLDKVENSNFLHMDIDQIGCDIWKDNVRTRLKLVDMPESEITCPAHVVTIICGILTCLLILMTVTCILFYLRFIKRRRKLLHDRSLRNNKLSVNVHDKILPHQPLSGGHNGTLGSIGYSHHQSLQGQSPLHPMHPLNHHEYQHTLPQMDKLELERYLAAQAIANEYRALKPWEVPVKDSGYSDEPEHLYERFDHYEYPDSHTINKSKQTSSSVGGSSDSGVGSSANTLVKPHIVYV